MERGTALKIEFWISDGTAVGLDELRAELDTDYIAVVQNKPKGLGGGVLHYLVVEVLPTISLVTTVRFLLEGAAYDLIKEGTKSLILRPLLRAFENLKKRNGPGEVDIGEFKITFEDVEVKIRSVADGTLTGNLESILRAVAQHHARLNHVEGGTLSAITVPVFEDKTEGSICRFREIGEIEEPVVPTGASDYFGYWGVEYGSGLRRVYDVQRELLIDEYWLTLMEYNERSQMQDLLLRSAGVSVAKE